jgi:hypothetical protein
MSDMDLNYYFHREQVERVRAQHAGSGEARDAHLGLAHLYRREIDAYRQTLRAELPRPNAK